MLISTSDVLKSPHDGRLMVDGRYSTSPFDPIGGRRDFLGSRPPPSESGLREPSRAEAAGSAGLPLLRRNAGPGCCRRPSPWVPVASAFLCFLDDCFFDDDGDGDDRRGVEGPLERGVALDGPCDLSSLRRSFPSFE